MQKNWVDIFRATVKQNMDKKAVIQGDESISFEQLNEKSLKIAQKILNNTNVYNRPIVVLLPKGFDVYYSDLGIMYSHNIFSNLDVKTPKERLNNIIETMQPIGIITNEACFKLIDILNSMFVINVDDIDDIKAEESEIMQSGEKQIDTDPMCIINTSGSTGTPKGVVLNHKSFFDFMDWSLETFDLKEDEKIGALSPIVFDIFEYELCLMMKRGVSIVLLNAGLAAFPAKLLQEVQKQEITFLFWVPTIMVNIANMDLLSKLPIDTVKTIWFAGEVFPTKQFNYWRRNLPKAVFANLYGPIEITLDCIYYIVEDEMDEDLPLPIGYPCRNTDILLLNDNNEKCALTEEGEICVRGTSLAMGYYNNPEKTAAAFVQNPCNNAYPELIYRTGDVALLGEDGLIHFKGRKDTLIKHMGYRIELGEIEHVIVNELHLVENCCVSYKYESKEIVLFYESKVDIEFKEIRKALNKVLPKYMIPSSGIYMEELPRNTNGKIDRLKLSKQINE